MPLHHHGGTPHTKRQQHAKTDADVAVLEESAGVDRPGIESEPFNHGRWEQAIRTSAGHRPAPTTGGTLSFSDEAEQLRSVASSREFPIALLQQASQSFDDMFAQCSQILGGQSQHTQTVGGAIEAAKAALQSALEAAKNVEKAIHDAADGHARG